METRWPLGCHVDADTSEYILEKFPKPRQRKVWLEEVFGIFSLAVEILFVELSDDPIE